MTFLAVMLNVVVVVVVVVVVACIRIIIVVLLEEVLILFGDVCQNLGDKKRFENWKSKEKNFKQHI